MRRKILLLGGTSEARRIAARLAELDHSDVVLSLAGVTPNPPDMGVETRIGGFSGGGFDGKQGLARYLDEASIDLVIDATHPYATVISANAAHACLMQEVERMCLWRLPWQASPGDDWQVYPSWDDLIAAIPDGAMVFLAAGQDGLTAIGSPQRFKVFARALVQPVGVDSSAVFIVSPPKDTPADEAELFQHYGITHVICKNSGGMASSAKLIAARQLGLSVLMLDRPLPPPPPLYDSPEAILDAIGMKIKGV
jgi:precorrin-6A/cobalt-precorrin-6A reductase